MGVLSNKPFLGFLLVVYLIPTTSFSQQSQELKLISYRTSNKIMLRWAPTKPTQWIENNRSGYTIERYTILRDSTRAYPPIKSIIAQDVKPVPVSKWDTESKQNDHAAIVAQAIYGASFLVEGSPEYNSALRMMQLAHDQEARYNYAILSCDLSYDVAKLAGLGFEDSLIYNNESYLYKIYNHASFEKADTAYLYVPAEESAPMPAINRLEGTFEDRTVTLRWELGFLNKYYATYIIEKSLDNKVFEAVSEKSTLFAVPYGTQNKDIAIKTDSLESNDVTYYYRIRGVSPFGITGPPSNVIFGIGHKSSNLEVAIVDIIGIDGKAKISWQTYPESLIDETLEITTILYSKDGRNFATIDSVSFDTRFFIDEIRAPSCYYKVEIKSRFGGRQTSLPYLFQSADSIPPAIPMSLIGVCDTIGNIKLNWQQNKEQDLEGYRVFRSLNNSSGFRQLTSTVIADTTFQDYIDLNAIRGRVYYKVEAVDFRGNRSNKTDATEVRLKDITGPVAPRLIDYIINDGKVTLAWAPSASKDVITYDLYKTVNDTLTIRSRIDAFRNDYTIIDSVLYPGKTNYYITAIDSTGNKSERSNDLVVNPNTKTGIKPNLTAIVDRTNNFIRLEWEMPNQVNEIRIFKAEGEDKVTLFKSLSGSTKAYEDKNLTVNGRYLYMVQFLTNTGSPKFSNELRIVF